MPRVGQSLLFICYHFQFREKEREMRILIVVLVLVKCVVGGLEEQETSGLNQTAYRDANGNRNTSEWDSERVFQGTPATGSYPFMVALVAILGSNPTPLIVCGGSLIDNQHVLTAAHCISTFTDIMNHQSRVEAWIGATDLDNFTGQRIQLQSFMRHPLYASFLFNWNDLAIITLAQRVRFNAQAAPICIGTRSYKDEPVSVVGFGISDCRQPSRRLLIGSGRAFSGGCRRIGYPTLTLRGQMCVQNMEAAADRGDSGGPLFTRSGNQFSLVGLVSHGYINETTLCPQLRVPTIYTQVSAYRLFIRLFAPGATFC